jgi:peptidoglycan/LPS O-acetylase OafA/YrhL
LEVLWPTFVGSLLFAVPCALISYWIVERSLEKYARLRHGRGTLAA